MCDCVTPSMDSGVSRLVLGLDLVSAGTAPCLQQPIEVRDRPPTGHDIGDTVAKRLDELDPGAGLRGREQPERRILHADGRQDLLKVLRSEERRVGKECRSRWSPYH